MRQWQLDRIKVGAERAEILRLVSETIEQNESEDINGNWVNVTRLIKLIGDAVTPYRLSFALDSLGYRRRDNGRIKYNGARCVFYLKNRDGFYGFAGIKPRGWRANRLW